MVTIDEKIALLKQAPYPENIYYFFLCTPVADIPQDELGCLFHWANHSLSFFVRFRDSDADSKEAEAKLKNVLMELYVRMELEHVPDLREPVVLRLHEKPSWEGLDLLWEVSGDLRQGSLREKASSPPKEEQPDGLKLTAPGEPQGALLQEKHDQAVKWMLLSRTARESGHLLTCEQRLREAIDLLADLSDETSLTLRAKALNLLANVLSEVRRFAEAEGYYLEAKDILEKLHLAKEISFVLHGLGNMYMSGEQPDQAISYFRESLSIKENITLTAAEIIPTLYGLAICYIKTDQIEQALKIIHKYEAIGDKDDQSLNELYAHLLAQQGDWAGTIEKLETLSSQSEEKLSPGTHVMIEMSLARAYNQLSEYKTAEQHFWRAFASIEEYMRKWLSPSMREGLRRASLPGIEQQFQAWRKRATPDTPANAEHNVPENAEILKVAERLSAIDLRAKFGAGKIAADINDSTLQILSEGELLVYLFGTDSTLYTFFVDRTGIIFADSTPYGEFSQFDLLPTLDYFLDRPDEPNESFERWANTVIVTVQLLFLVNKEISKICLFFPFGKGNNIPWDFFIRNAHKFSPKPTPPLFETVPISRLPSFSVFQTLKDYPVRKGVGPPAVFVDPVGRFTPLQATLEEAEAIEKVFPEMRFFGGRAASIDNLTRVMRPTFLHISCHGEFVLSQPLESSLLLSANHLSLEEEWAWREWQKDLLRFLKQNPSSNIKEYQQDQPTPYEGDFPANLFRSLKLRGTEFVFLSACSAARVSDYDEIEGFAQSVFLAGCPNLIAPLWPVDVKATVLFVKQFYTEYKNLTDLDILPVGKIGKCIALAKNALLKAGFSSKEAAAWTLFGVG